MIKELNKRNTETVEIALRDIYSKYYDQQALIDNLHAGIATMQQRMSALEQQLIIQKVQLTGLGPSVKG